MTEDEAIEFIRAHIGSVYTLEVLLVMKRDSAKEWQVADLVRELRSSKTAITDALSRLRRVELVVEKSPGQFAFAPTSTDRENAADVIEKLYSLKPISVVKAIMSVPDDKLRAFSDAFRLKE